MLCIVIHCAVMLLVAVVDHVIPIKMPVSIERSQVAEVPPKARVVFEAAVPAAPAPFQIPVPITVEVTPGAPSVRTTKTACKNQASLVNEVGTVCVMEAPRVTP